MAKKRNLPSVSRRNPAEQAQIIQWIAAGNSVQQVMEAIGQHFPKLDARAELIAAMKQIDENAKADPQFVRAWTFEAGRELYRRMVEANDFAGALKALKFINETVESLNEPVNDEPKMPDF